jgi:hypothetical protein
VLGVAYELAGEAGGLSRRETNPSSTAYGIVVGIYPIPDYPVLPEPEP